MAGIIGLSNLGNTCYMNTILQCLSQTEELRTHFLSGEFVQALKENISNKYKINITNDNQIKGFLSDSVSYQLYVVFHELWDSNNKTAYSPRDFKTIAGNKIQMIRGTEQRDCHEFLANLLDTLNNELMKQNIEFKIRDQPLLREIFRRTVETTRIINSDFPNEVKQQAIDELKLYKKEHEKESVIWDSCVYWKNYAKSGYSIITKTFTGTTYTKITCPECKNNSIVFEPFVYLSVAIPKIVDVNINDCLDNHCNSEQLDNDNKWKCPDCKKDVNGIKMINLWKLPYVLIIQLKRFEKKGKRLEKIDTPVKFNDTLIVDKYVNEMYRSALGERNITYKLYAIGNHSGTASGGHYYAYCKNSEQNKWYCYNDSNVSEIVKDIDTQNAYILFYKLE
jgi:ubiquitin carboxyl-terminal hydrolase 8